MKRPNSELFRIMRFAIHYPGWHTFAPDVRKHIKRASELGMLDVNWLTKQFRLPQPTTHQVTE